MRRVYKADLRGGDFTCAAGDLEALDVAPGRSVRGNVGVVTDSLSNEHEGAVKDQHVGLPVSRDWCKIKNLIGSVGRCVHITPRISQSFLRSPERFGTSSRANR